MEEGQTESFYDKLLEVNNQNWFLFVAFADNEINLCELALFAWNIKVLVINVLILFGETFPKLIGFEKGVQIKTNFFKS